MSKSISRERGIDYSSLTIKQSLRIYFDLKDLNAELMLTGFVTEHGVENGKQAYLDWCAQRRERRVQELLKNVKARMKNAKPETDWEDTCNGV